MAKYIAVVRLATTPATLPGEDVPDSVPEKSIKILLAKGQIAKKRAATAAGSK